MANKRKGFDDWVEIFAGGTQKSSSGKIFDGDDLIDKAVSTFDPAFHEPPAVVGHPEENDPAYGLVNALKVDTSGGRKVLLARFKDVEPTFADMVKKGRFPKRSAAFYNDGRLRHVGFLGAMPPAVKGLKNMTFASGEADAEFEFSEPRPWTWGAIAEVFRRMREYFIETEGAERADAIIPEWDIREISDEERRAAEPKPQEDESMKFSEFFEAFKIWKKFEKDPDASIDVMPSAPGGQFSETDIKKAKEEAAAKAKADAEAEFAEKQRKAGKKQRDAEIVSWVDGKVTDGAISPALRDSGLVAFMQGLADDAIEFAEGEEKQSPLDWFKGLFKEDGENPLFSEIATKSGASAKQKDADAEFALGKDIGERANR